MRSAIVALALLAALSPAASQTCEPSVAQAALQEAHVYVVVQTDVLAFEESNGIPGLQRQDGSRDDTCGGYVDADARII